MVGSIRDIEVDSESDEDFEEEEEKPVPASPGKSKGMFSMFRGLVGSKALTKEDMLPVLDKMRDHLIAKNVAAEIAIKLCESVAVKLEGKVSLTMLATLCLINGYFQGIILFSDTGHL